jgi:hypothetical protein
MILPGDELKVNIHHIGMCNDNIVVKIETINDHGEKVLNPLKLCNPPLYTFSLVKVHKKQAWKWISTIHPLQHAPFGMMQMLTSLLCMASPLSK